MKRDFKGKKTAIIGLGVEGLTSVRYLKQHGADVTVLDQKTEKELDQDILREAKRLGASLLLGKNYLEDLSNFETIVRSPGIRRNIEEFAQAEKKGIEITSQTKLFFELCPCPIIGVTGTKGKGTTSALIYEMLKKQGFDAHLGGNIGTPPLDFLDKLRQDSWVVLELSSFQLQDVTKSLSFAKASAGKPHIAVVLMVTSEHLDYHRDTYEYVDAKRNILRYQTEKDFAVINRDYPASNESDIHTQAQVFQVSRGRGVREQGCFVENGKVILKIAKRSDLSSTQGPTLTQEIEVIDAKDILLLGKHNLENVCAAVMAGYLAGVSTKSIRQVLKTFKGLEHRLQLVDIVNGVRYYDDSFSTTPETAIAAIEAFSEPKILILGGSRKGSDFTELGNVISGSDSIRAIIGIGVEWEKIKSIIQSSRFRIIERKKNMREIVEAAAEIAQLGDVVLLSPACASFDLFKNYKDRGDQFKEEVMNLKTS